MNADRATPIVVGVDGSFVALHGACWAGALAERIGAPLHIVTGTPYVGHNPSEAVAAARAAALAAHAEGARCSVPTRGLSHCAQDDSSST